MANQVSDASIAVLLVDDQRFIFAALSRLLTNDQDITLHHCQQAAEAVARASAIHPALILQDLVLPDGDGLTMIRLFRANPATAGTPVVILSVTDDEETRARARAAGACDYLVKLPDREQLVACIRRHATSACAAVESPPAAAEETLGMGVLDELREAGGGTLGEFGVMLIDQFIDEATSQAAVLREARRRGDGAAFKATLHGLKGCSLTMGARRLAGLCAAMEQQLAGAALEHVSANQIADIDLELVRVCASLSAERVQALLAAGLASGDRLPPSLFAAVLTADRVR
jgi:DNA-binding response OmpR family regulator